MGGAVGSSSSHVSLSARAQRPVRQMRSPVNLYLSNHRMAAWMERLTRSSGWGRLISKRVMPPLSDEAYDGNSKARAGAGR